MKRFLKPLLLLLATCLLLLLLGEVLASFTPEGNAAVYVADPVLGMLRKPNQDGFTWGNGRWIAAHIDKQGLRGDDVPLSKPPGERWVLCLGDSFTFGGGVETDEAWPQQLQAQLGPPDTSGVRVLNAGANGWDTRWQRLYLEARGLPDLTPDVVVLGWNWNDLNVEVGPDAMWKSANHFLHVEGSWLSMFEDWPIIPGTHLFRWLFCTTSGSARVPGEKQLKNRFAKYKDTMLAVAVTPEEKLLPIRQRRYGDGPVPPEFWVATDTAIWKQVREEITTMKRLCDEHGAVFVVAMLPEPTWPGPGPFPAVVRLAALLDELHVPWVDVQQDFLGRDSDGAAVGRRNELWLRYDPVHPTAEGQRIMADAILGLLRNGGLVGP